MAGSLEDSIIGVAEISSVFTSLLSVMGVIMFSIALFRFVSNAKEGREISDIIPQIMVGLALTVTPLMISSVFNESSVKDQFEEQQSTIVKKDKKENIEKISTPEKIPTAEELVRLEKAAQIKRAEEEAASAKRSEEFKNVLSGILTFIVSLGACIILYSFFRYKIVYSKTNKLINMEDSFENIVSNIEMIDDRIKKNDAIIIGSVMFVDKIKSINEKLKVKRSNIEEVIKDFEDKLAVSG